MKLTRFFKLIGRSIDPRRDFVSEIPRAFLFSKLAVEYIFRLIGFFILICLVVGLTLSSCTQNPFLQLLPPILAVAFFFYIAITTIGIPCFFILGEIQNTFLRRALSYFVVLIMLFLTIYSVVESPIFDILLTYVGKFFPAAYECKNTIIELDRIN